MANSAHVIVVGNEKGGSGKSTTAFHLAVYLLHQGFRVATIDVDSRQQTLTHYVRNRLNWADKRDVELLHTIHYHLPMSDSDSVTRNDQIEFDLFRQAISEVEAEVDFLIIDTPGFNTHLTRLAHSMADTLVTPVNDSLIDLDVLAHVNPFTNEISGLSHYTRLVLDSRKQRMVIDGSDIDWIIMRNRISSVKSRNMHVVRNAVEKLGARLGARVAKGINERVIFRSLFPIGMTVFDPLTEEMIGIAPTMSHMSARQEYRDLVETLELPLSDEARERRAARETWREVAETDLDVSDALTR